MDLDNWKCESFDSDDNLITLVGSLTGSVDVTMEPGTNEPVISVDIDTSGTTGVTLSISYETT